MMCCLCGQHIVLWVCRNRLQRHEGVILHGINGVGVRGARSVDALDLAQQRQPDFEEVAGICVIAVGGWEAL